MSLNGKKGTGTTCLRQNVASPPFSYNIINIYIFNSTDLNNPFMRGFFDLMSVIMVMLVF